MACLTPGAPAMLTLLSLALAWTLTCVVVCVVKLANRPK
jgi:hypothetical protein